MALGGGVSSDITWLDFSQSRYTYIVIEYIHFDCQAAFPTLSVHTPMIYPG